MGFGLHAGWAIEGAVGSKQKVDATYLSPHVNMAARLETSSRQYGVPLLASQVGLVWLVDNHIKSHQIIQNQIESMSVFFLKFNSVLGDIRCPIITKI